MPDKIKDNILKPGEIRHPSVFPDSIMKCIGPFDSEHFSKMGEVVKSDMFILTKDFPKHHFIVVIKLLNNYFYPDYQFCLAHLITHSSNFDNMKISENLYNKNSTVIKLTNSYITRDKFLLLTSNIDNEKCYGYFEMEKLADVIVY